MPHATKGDWYRFRGWYFLGQRGVWLRLGYDSWEDLLPLGVRLRKPLVALGWILVKTHNTRWRLGCLVELLRRNPRIRWMQ